MIKRRALLPGLILVVASFLNVAAQDIYLSPLTKFNTGAKEINSISFSPNAKFISVSNVKGEVTAWGTEDQKKVKDFGARGSLILQKFYDEGKILFLDKAGKISRFDLIANAEQPGSQITSGVKEACIDPTNQYVAAFLKENIIEMFDLKTNMTLGRITVNTQVKNVGYLGYDRFGQQISLISNTGDALSWNALNQKFLRELKLRSSEYANSSSVIHSSSANSGSDRFLLGLEEVFIPQGGFMNTSNRLERRNFLLSYDWQSGQEQKKISTKYLVNGMAAGPGPSHVSFYSSASQAIVLYNLEKSEATSVVSVDEKPSAIALSGDNQYLAVGTVAGNVYLYEVVRNNPAEIKITKPHLNRNYGDQVVKETSVGIEGIIDGKDKISRIFVNGMPAQVDNKNFSANVTLTKGKNRIRIAAQTTENVITEKDFYLTCEPDPTLSSKTPSTSDKSKRIALVVGNSNYVSGNKLINTINDAKAIATVLQELGFEVISVYDGDYEKMKNSIYGFGDKIADADISLFYYAGHGIEVDGTNYLLPVDANIQSALDVKQKALALTGVLRTMEYANDEGLNMIILDACRNNPFPTGKRGGAGLARVQAPSGTLIAYATDPGSTASDGEGKNGLYTGELVKQLGISQRIEDIFMNTRNAVEKVSEGKQRPWEEARLKGVFYLK